jgi:preprotein translocase subunit SecE
MFDSLDEQMRNDDNKVSSSRERAMKWLLVVLISVMVFGGLYYGVHMLQGS